LLVIAISFSSTSIRGFAVREVADLVLLDVATYVAEALNEPPVIHTGSINVGWVESSSRAEFRWLVADSSRLVEGRPSGA
jgi:hypothetical protein